MAILLVFTVFIFVPLEKSSVKKLDCSKQPDVYYLRPQDAGNIQPILKSNENAIVVIPEEHEVRANTVLLNCPGINFTQYVGGFN